MTDRNPGIADGISPQSARKFKGLFKERPALGAWADIPSVVTAEIMAAAGFDFALIDLEHGSASFETALAQIIAAERWGAAPILRTPMPEDPWIKRALDIGAAGVMAPSVHSVEAAQTAASAFRYGPDGRRGVAARIVRAARYGADGDYESRWNDAGFLILQIESPEGLAAAEQIARVDGVDALFFGPSDFAAAAGYPGAAEVGEAWRDCMAAARRAGVYVGTTPFGALSAADLIGMGADIVTVASDVSILRKGAAAALEAVRGAG